VGLADDPYNIRRFDTGGKGNRVRIGFTGTRKGLTEKQKRRLIARMKSLAVIGTEAHHGMCVGADAEFSEIATS